MLFMLAAWITDGIGIHAVFGGFLLGIAMPRGLFARELQRQLEPFAVVFLLRCSSLSLVLTRDWTW
jgi:Kef-type K+ transport system membrane component KefB